jgi:uncharacterized protein (DUF302 family)
MSMWIRFPVKAAGASALIVLTALGWSTSAVPAVPEKESKVNKSDDAVVTVASAHAHAETVERFKAQLAKKGIRLFALIDHAAEAKQAGLALRPTQVLIFGNPKAGTPLMLSKQTIGLDLPLRVLVWEDEHGKIWLTYTRVALLAQRHEIADRDEAVKALDAALAALVRDASAP